MESPSPSTSPSTPPVASPSASAFRLPEGGRVNRARPVSFSFNGRAMTAFAGDTLASALLANGVRVVSRSFKYRRPRGIYSAGPEEPNAVFAIGEGAELTPNCRATLTQIAEGMSVRSQGGNPNLDPSAALGMFSRLLPPGFYYKTFMWPPRLWMFYEKIIRRAASAAPTPREADPDRYLHRHAYCDVLVVGGGPAGLSAALAAARAGARVILTELRPELGGDLLSESEAQIDKLPAAEWAQNAEQQLQSAANVSVLKNTTAQGCHDYNYVTALEDLENARAFRDPFYALDSNPASGSDSNSDSDSDSNSDSPSTARPPRHRLWKIRAKRIVVAAGALERPMVFAGNDLPGVMLASAARTYINQYAVRPGRRMLFFVNNDGAYQAALDAHKAGALVEVADIRADAEGAWQERLRVRKIPARMGFGVVGANRVGDTLAVRLAKLAPNADAIVPGGELLSHAYDAVAVSGGWTPTAHLFSQARGKLNWNSRLGAFIPGESHPLNPCHPCGAAAGVLSLGKCLADGFATGKAAAEAAGFKFPEGKVSAARATPAILESPPLHSALIPATHPVGRGPGKHFVDLMNDVTAADIDIARREGYDTPEHMKRYTAAGFGTDQGKTGNINALCILARSAGKRVEDLGHTTFRPNYTPMTFGALQGLDRGALFAPERTTPMHERHLARGAVFEDVGEWKRPRYFPLEGENMDAAVARECRAARDAVAVMDASTLGKIDIQGADAGKFLDMIYTGMFSTLKVGRCRYGLMLNEHGMIFDDGVSARLGANHFHMTTTTGGAARVLTWLEEWLQTEWPTMKVFCQSVTEQWAVAALAGPRARDVLARVTDIPLDAERLPFMSARSGTVAGVGARIFRVSFSGEWACEINVPARYGAHLWDALLKAGEDFGVAPYGTEAMHVLRAEKGFIIAGQDSDGTMTPADMGLDALVSRKKADFIGRRSLSRADTAREGRLQFSGLLTEEPDFVLPEGAALVESERAAAPLRTIGHVTSSYASANLGRSIALAMLENGFARAGETVWAALTDGRRVAARVCGPVFWDEKGGRRNG